MNRKIVRTVMTAAGSFYTFYILLINGKLVVIVAVFRSFAGNIIGNSMAAAPICIRAIGCTHFACKECVVFVVPSVIVFFIVNTVSFFAIEKKSAVLRIVNKG